MMRSQRLVHKTFTADLELLLAGCGSVGPESTGLECRAPRVVGDTAVLVVVLPPYLKRQKICWSYYLLQSLTIMGVVCASSAASNSDWQYHRG